MNINHLSDDDLLQGLTDRDATPDNPVEIWIQYAGLRPGATRVITSSLYAEYKEWWEQIGRYTPGTTAKIMPPGQWGAVMCRQFKRGKSNSVRWYYVSREKDSEVLEKLGL